MQRIYHVTMRADGQWQGGDPRKLMPLFLADTQQEAEDTMCEIAMAIGDAQVLVFDAAGEKLRALAYDRVDLARTSCL